MLHAVHPMILIQSLKTHNRLACHTMTEGAVEQISFKIRPHHSNIQWHSNGLCRSHNAQRPTGI